MVIISAVVRVKEGKGPVLEKAFLELQPKVLKDPGAITYLLHRAVDDPCKFFVLERYENQEALDYHMSTDHFKAFFKEFEPLMTGTPEVGFYQEVK